MAVNRGTTLRVRGGRFKRKKSVSLTVYVKAPRGPLGMLSGTPVKAVDCR